MLLYHLTHLKNKSDSRDTNYLLILCTIKSDEVKDEGVSLESLEKSCRFHSRIMSGCIQTVLESHVLSLRVSPHMSSVCSQCLIFEVSKKM